MSEKFKFPLRSQVSYSGKVVCIKCDAGPKNFKYILQRPNGELSGWISEDEMSAQNKKSLRLFLAMMAMSIVAMALLLLGQKYHDQWITGCAVLIIGCMIAIDSKFPNQ